MPAKELRDRIAKYPGTDITEHPGLAVLLDDSDDGNREVEIVVVGIGQKPGLERIIDYLGTAFTMPIRAVTFDVFQGSDGKKLLVREEAITQEPAPVGPSVAAKLEAVIQRAGGPSSPHGQWLRLMADTAEENGLYVKPYKWSLMFTPQDRKIRFLVTVGSWGAVKNDLGLIHSATAFEEFFAITADVVRELLGPDDQTYALATDADVHEWAAKFDALFAAIETNSMSGATS